MPLSAAYTFKDVTVLEVHAHHLRKIYYDIWCIWNKISVVISILPYTSIKPLGPAT